MRLISFIIKFIVAVVIIWFALQFEYNGRKLQTYVVEFFKSSKVHENVEGTKAVLSGKKAAPAKTNKDDDTISDEERKELQKVLE